MNAIETRLQGRVDRREVVQSKHEALLVEKEDGALSDTDKKQIEMYREELAEIDAEIAQLVADKEAADRAAETAKALHRARIGALGTDADGETVVYRTFAEYARDRILTEKGQRFAPIQRESDVPLWRLVAND